MATRILPFTVTIPVNTPINAPFTQPINLDGWTIERIDLEVPAGPSGLMGFQIYNNAVAWIPYGAGQWIRWDNKGDTYYLTDQPNAGGWAIVGYNLDPQYTHDVTIRFHVHPATDDAPPEPPAPLTFIVTQPAPAEAVTL